MKDFDLLKNNAVWGENQTEIYNSNLAFCYSADLFGEVNLKLTCSGIYRLTVNGNFIGYGPARTAHGYARVDEYSFMAKGLTHVVIESVNYNVNSYYLIKQSGFFTASLSQNGKVFATANDFDCYDLTDRIKKVQRFSFQRPFVEAYSFAGEREKLYGGLKPNFPLIKKQAVGCPVLLARDMPYPKLDKINATCIERGTASYLPNKPVWEDRSIDEIGETLLGFKREELDICVSDVCSRYEYKKASSNSTLKGVISDGEYCVFDFERNVSGFFGLEIEVFSDAEIYLTFDEIDFQKDANICTDGVNVCFNRNACCNVIYWKLKKGKYSLLSIEPNTARFARVLSVGGKAECVLNMVKYQNDQMYNLKFTCQNEKLNKIVKVAQHSLAQNTVDCIYDCPSRERAGWLNDSWFTCEAEKLLSGNVLADRALLSNLLLAPDLKELPNGVFPMCYPSDHLDGNYCPTLICWTVLDVIKHVDYTGDEDFYNAYKPKIERALKFLEKYENEFGLLENLEGWVFIEWSKANDFIDGVHIPTNMLYYGTLIKYAQKENDARLLQKAEKLKNTIIDLAFNGKFFEDHLIRKDGGLKLNGDVSETCQYFAFFFDVADKNNFPELYKAIITEFGPSRDALVSYPSVVPSNLITGIYLREEVLFRAKEYSHLIDELIDIFYPMANQTGTLWECFDNGEGNSDNHGLTACVASWIVKAISGFNSPKIGEYEFLPTPVDLKCEIEFPLLNKVVKFKR